MRGELHRNCVEQIFPPLPPLLTPFLQLSLTAVAVSTGGGGVDSLKSSETSTTSSKLTEPHQDIYSPLPRRPHVGTQVKVLEQTTCRDF